MFDFLKKLFGKKPEPVKQNTEPNLPVHVSNDVKKPAAESLPQKPSVSKYTDQNRPGVALEIQRPRKLTDDYPQNSAPVQTSRPTVQPTRSAVQPVQPVTQPTQPVVNRRNRRRPRDIGWDPKSGSPSPRSHTFRVWLRS